MGPVVPCGSNTSHIYQHRPSCWAMKPDTTLSSSLGPEDILAPGGSTAHSDLYVPNCHVTLEHHNGLRRLTRYRASAGPSVATRGMDINSYPVGCRVANPDMILNNSLGPDDTMAFGVSTSRSYPHDPQTPARLQVAAQTPGFHVAFAHQPILFRHFFFY